MLIGYTSMLQPGRCMMQVKSSWETTEAYKIALLDYARTVLVRVVDVRTGEALPVSVRPVKAVDSDGAIKGKLY